MPRVVMYITFSHLHLPTQVRPLSVKVMSNRETCSKNTFTTAGKLMSQNGAATTIRSASARVRAASRAHAGMIPAARCAYVSGVSGSIGIFVRSNLVISYRLASASMTGSAILLVRDSSPRMHASITTSFFMAINLFCKYTKKNAPGKDDGARTHDTRNHNPMLYQLNYIHHVMDCKGTKKFVPCKG